MLCRFVDPHGLLDSAKGPRQPLVIFAFDDAHVLTDNPITDSWNLFSELRHNLRRIYKLPIFSLFISKAGKFNLSSPISEISFDDPAYSALGRPLYVHPGYLFKKQLTSFPRGISAVLLPASPHGSLSSLMQTQNMMRVVGTKKKETMYRRRINAPRRHSLP
ncbi:hypothetical protein BJV77DRAFT_1045991 [Russula vinacea]|nr:hypothetical protein BJV77DRAFT_1045991 [Russula vinacea]